MNLIIDVGNTRIKIAVFENSEMIYNEVFTKVNFIKSVFDVIEKYNCKYAIIASVGSIKKSEIDLLKNKINLIDLNFETKIPFRNEYETPKTLGVDRIALVSAAVSKYPNKNTLIIDAGTCITYDFIDDKACYHGGAISPGIKMRYKALNKFTQKLPLLEPEYIDELIGNSTKTSIHLGVIKGVISEIDGFIEQYRKKNKDLTVVLTGGDVNFLANRLKNSIFANPNFLLEGLNSILTYNI
jgi:type III pantothenate kinase